jgi:hypothetical protein
MPGQTGRVSGILGRGLPEIRQSGQDTRRKTVEEDRKAKKTEVERRKREEDVSGLFFRLLSSVICYLFICLLSVVV